MSNEHTEYSDDDICKDIADAELSIIAIAEKHGISDRQVYRITDGTSRPELLVRINELIEAGKQAGIRLAKSKALWAVRRLAELAKQDVDRGAALRATMHLLEMGGLLAEGGGDQKQIIEIVLSAKADADGTSPLDRRLTGVSIGEN